MRTYTYRCTLKPTVSTVYSLTQVYQGRVLPFGPDHGPSNIHKSCDVSDQTATYSGDRHQSISGRLAHRVDVCSDPIREYPENTSLLNNLGFLINEKKSQLTPTQNLVFLGMELDTRKGIVMPSQGRVDWVIEMSLSFSLTPPCDNTSDNELGRYDVLHERDNSLGSPQCTPSPAELNYRNEKCNEGTGFRPHRPKRKKITWSCEGANPGDFGPSDQCMHAVTSLVDTNVQSETRSTIAPPKSENNGDIGCLSSGVGGRTAWTGQPRGCGHCRKPGTIPTGWNYRQYV